MGDRASNLARVIELPQKGDRARRNVVAVVLEDGTVRRMDGKPAGTGSDWKSGQITGEDWVLWWQRRSFEPQ